MEKSHHSENRKKLDSEIRELQGKIARMEEDSVKTSMDLSKKIEELESKVRKYELEIEQWKNSQNLAQKRHDEEMKALEGSHK